MTRRLALSAVLLALGLGAAALVLPVAAQEKAAGASPAGSYQIDTAHTSIAFKVRHFFSKVPGRFTGFSGAIQFDPAKPAATYVAVEIDAVSINTDNTKRDDHLRSPDFFDAEKFPKITFKSTAIKLVDATHATMTGDLTMRGVTKPVTLDVELLGNGPNGRGGMLVGFAATGKLNRMDYGVAWNRALEGGGAMLGDEVELTFSVEAVKPGPAAK
jgi:polyisoprenoid-binding protein YceI